MLADRSWKRKYTPDDGDLIRLFYVPALEDAERYDRLTGYFNAGALALAARGVEGLVRNGGRMRLVVGCTLQPPEIEAIEQGETLRDLVGRRAKTLPLAPPDAESSEALELLAWMIARGHLDVKVAVPCDAGGKPIPSDGIFHEKAGIIEDRTGDRLAWNGSLNETAAGWRTNWESINVYTSWGPEAERIGDEEANFARIWEGRTHRVIVLDVPEAVRRDLMRFMPSGDMPSRLRDMAPAPSESEPGKANETPERALEVDLRSQVWNFIEHAPALPGGGAFVGEATSAVTPWPHQARAFDRLYENWPPRLLIADEVGLGKTIQAGLLLRQAWLSGRARRILILAPKAVLRQWQIELREKFNLNWPIYDGRRLTRYPSPALAGASVRETDRTHWHEEPAIIVSSHLMRRADRAQELLDAKPWDLVVLDEAHHARRRGAGAAQESRPNALLRLMRELERRTDGLVLLTATPMQMHPVEVWDLLDLLGLPPEWSEAAFLQFFEDAAEANPSHDALDRMARLFQAAERRYGEIGADEARRVADLSRLRTNRVIGALRDAASIPRRQLETSQRRALVRIVQAHTPVRRLISRHTRELLRRYFKAGKMDTAIADRSVRDVMIDMTAEERALYEAVEGYISHTYNRASDKHRSAVGFVMTIYRRRLASSFQALRATLERHLAAITGGGELELGLEEDALDDETMDDMQDADEVEEKTRLALVVEEEENIRELLEGIARLQPDTKLGHLRTVLQDLRRDGYEQAMVFTQFTDTMDFLRDSLREEGERRLMCFSGRGGEVPDGEGWRVIDRDQAKRLFRDGEADILICTDAAAEGLNFQFCGALVNYDMPWNPMRVEQRIGRIDRLGQKHSVIRIVNLHYEDTVETDVYRALRHRIGLFQSVVGRLQPILAQLPRRIADAAVSRTARDAAARAGVTESIERQLQETEAGGFDLDAVLEEDLVMPDRPASPVVMDDLDRLISSPDLMPPGTEIKPMGPREYSLLAPGMPTALRVTTDPEYYEANADSLELWSPGNPLFRAPEFVGEEGTPSKAVSLSEVLNTSVQRRSG